MCGHCCKALVGLAEAAKVVIIKLVHYHLQYLVGKDGKSCWLVFRLMVFEHIAIFVSHKALLKHHKGHDRAATGVNLGKSVLYEQPIESKVPSLCI